MRRRGARRLAWHYVSAVILGVLLLFLIAMVVDIVRKEEVARRAAKDARKELNALTMREGILRKNLEDLDTPRGQEASIRETYGVAREGEEVIIVVEPEPEKLLLALPWWNKFLGFFGF